MNHAMKESKKMAEMKSLFTKFKDFDYDFPDLYYDKETGEVKIRQKEENTASKRQISGPIELGEAYKELNKEEGLSDNGMTILG
jgi:hypothetical protein